MRGTSTSKHGCSKQISADQQVRALKGEVLIGKVCSRCLAGLPAAAATAHSSIVPAAIAAFARYPIPVIPNYSDTLTASQSRGAATSDANIY